MPNSLRRDNLNVSLQSNVLCECQNRWVKRNVGILTLDLNNMLVFMRYEEVDF